MNATNNLIEAFSTKITTTNNHITTLDLLLIKMTTSSIGKRKRLKRFLITCSTEDKGKKETDTLF
jgi:hypothetical protein